MSIASEYIDQSQAKAKLELLDMGFTFGDSDERIFNWAFAKGMECANNYRRTLDKVFK